VGGAHRLDRVDVPPASDEFELSVFGANVGEALAIHVGSGLWGLIDSLRDPDSTAPASLDYLMRLGVSPDDVKFVIATHWHDDHIDGLAEIVERCRTAMFGCSVAYAGREFEAVTLEYPRAFKTSMVREMRRCAELVEDKARKQSDRPPPKRIIEHQNVWCSDEGSVVLHALAPTSGALTRAEQDIVGTLLPDAQRRSGIGRITPNQASVVLTVQMAGDSLLLGGDLEERGSGGTGWSAVVDRFPSTHERSSIFKIPHHGSSGAHHDGQWTTLLTADPGPAAAVTRFASSHLPRDADLRRILGLAESVYLCGYSSAGDQPLSGPERRAIAADGVKLVVSPRVGQVRFRRKFADAPGAWKVSVFGNAREVTQEMVAPREVTPRRRGRGRRSH
jgi:hypothetical protein